MDIQKSARSCPACGSGLSAAQAICGECCLVIPTYKEAAFAAARPSLSSNERLKVFTFRFVLCAVLIVGMAILRYFVDRPPVSLVDASVCTLFLLLAARWGGISASIIAIVVIIGTDYFLIDPIMQLGVKSWSGLLEIAGSAAVGTSIGIFTIRFLACRNSRLRILGK